MGQVRSFIAIELPTSVKDCLADLIGTLKKGSHLPLKWAPADDVHLTVKFLGNVDTGRIPDVAWALSHACDGVPPLTLSLGEMGAFPSVDHPRVVWIGLTGELDRLVSLHQIIDSHVSPLGFPSEDRAFSPHLTLARARDNMSLPDRHILGQMIRKNRQTPACEFIASTISLMGSQLTPAGAIYTRLDSMELRA